MSEVTKCDVCKKPADKKCAKCQNVFYCSKEHQTEGWKKHQKLCRPFKICYDEQIGRCCVATTSIKEGDVVLFEAPLVAAPNESSVLTCLGCLNGIDNEMIEICSKCDLPFCSQECTNCSSHIPECSYITRKGKKISVDKVFYYQMFPFAIFTLRCLYQKKHFPEIWKRLIKLESHAEVTGNKNFELAFSSIIEIIYETFQLQEEFSKEEIRKVFGIIYTNSFAVASTEPHHSALYEIASLFEHNCRANCVRAYDSKGSIRIVAGMPIEKGEHLSIYYVLWYVPTFQRQADLLSTKFFLCRCNRCKDVTELGTYSSALKCKTNKCQGFILPESFLIPNLIWKCNKCGFKITPDCVKHMFNNIDKGIETITGSLAVKAFLKDIKKILPHNSTYLTRTKEDLVLQLAHATERELKELSNADLQLKVSLCHEVLKSLQLVAPGETWSAADMSHHLQMSLGEMYRRKSAKGKFSVDDKLKILKERILHLEKVIRSFKYKFLEREKYEIAKNQLQIATELMEKLHK